MALVIGVVVLGTASESKAVTNEELLEIIKQQGEQIERLNKRLDELERAGQDLEKTAQDAEEKAAAAEAKAEEAAEKVQKVEEDSPDIKVKWSPGPTISSKDGSWSVHVRGRLLVDGGLLDDDDGLYDDDNATELRAARLGVEGKFFQGFEYKFETDFADNDVDIKDAFIEYSGGILDPVHVRVGQFKTPNSLEELSSARFITFMERGAITDAFELNRRIGIGTGLNGDNWGAEVGLFGQNADDDAPNEGFAASGRGHYAFLYGQGDGRDAIHLGASVRYRDLDNDADDSMVRYRQRPFFHFTDLRSVNTGFIGGAKSDVFVGGEFAWIDGPFSFQSEVANTALQLEEGSDPNNLWGGYASLSYFLTGEHRNYNPKSGTFGRVKVNDPVHGGGPGAWEIGIRLDYIDLNDGIVQGGEQYSVIAGVNLYLNNYSRIMLDGAVTQVSDAAGDAAAIGSEKTIWGGGARVQIDW